jgi:hypothetical protein
VDRKRATLKRTNLHLPCTEVVAPTGSAVTGHITAAVGKTTGNAPAVTGTVITADEKQQTSDNSLHELAHVALSDELSVSVEKEAAFYSALKWTRRATLLLLDGYRLSQLRELLADHVCNIDQVSNYCWHPQPVPTSQPTNTQQSKPHSSVYACMYVFVDVSVCICVLACASMSVYACIFIRVCVRVQREFDAERNAQLELFSKLLVLEKAGLRWLLDLRQCVRPITSLSELKRVLSIAEAMKVLSSHFACWINRGLHVVVLKIIPFRLC